jgi:DNA polymerase-4
MFQALKLCPEAVVLRGRMDVYAEVSRQIRALMEDLTPAIEPLSLDEAFLDLTGTARLHGAPPAILLARLTKAMQGELGITGSIGLSHNKFLAKLASDMDKPQGFSVIGRAETLDVLAQKPVGVIWGLGAAGQAALAEAGIRTIADLRRWDRDDLIRRFGSQGMRLWHLARGEDARPVSRDRAVKSISNETTFSGDIAETEILDGHIWRLAEKVSDRAKANDLAGRTVTLKLKRNDFRTLTRRITLPDGTQTADRLYRAARGLFDAMDHPKPYRLLGVGLADLIPAQAADREGDLLDPSEAARREAERATDRIRARFGPDAILKGRALR